MCLPEMVVLLESCAMRPASLLQRTGAKVYTLTGKKFVFFVFDLLNGQIKKRYIFTCFRINHIIFFSKSRGRCKKSLCLLAFLVCFP